MSTAADALLREAHDRGYRFPAAFGGFAARVHWATPEGAGESSVRIELDGGPRIDAEGLDDWASGQLRSVIGHRAARSYEDGDGATAKRVSDETHALGQKVELDDELDSSYLVGDGQIAAVTRTAHGTRFTIVVQGRTSAIDGTSVPTEFCVVFWDGDGSLQAAEAYTDAYVELDGVLVPASRTVVRADADGLGVRKLVLSEHAPLAVAVTS